MTSVLLDQAVRTRPVSPVYQQYQLRKKEGRWKLARRKFPQIQVLQSWRTKALAAPRESILPSSRRTLTTMYSHGTTILIVPPNGGPQHSCTRCRSKSLDHNQIHRPCPRSHVLCLRKCPQRTSEQFQAVLMPYEKPHLPLQGLSLRRFWKTPFQTKNLQNRFPLCRHQKVDLDLLRFPIPTSMDQDLHVATKATRPVSALTLPA